MILLYQKFDKSTFNCSRNEKKAHSSSNEYAFAFTSYLNF